jgi:SAM-dependent methyltransferase
MVGYDAFAPLYDEVLGNRYHAALVPRLLKSLRKLKVPMPARILDLGCGTGKLAAFFRERGCAVVALDLSLGMLREGATRFACPRVNGDMARFAFRRPFDLVLCMYDSLNHLTTDADVRSMLSGVFSTLEPGGVFLFDSNNLWAFRHVFGSREPYRHEDETGWAEMKTGYDRASGTAWAHVNGGGPGGPFEDSLMERYYAREDLERWLMDAGFAQIKAEGWSPGRAYSGRNVKDFWTARRF